MDERSIQTQMAEKQQLIFAILGVIYQSEYPITLETIAYKVQNISPNKLFNVVTDLVMTGYLRVHMRDGCVNYHKPNPVRGPLLPLPYFSLFD